MRSYLEILNELMEVVETDSMHESDKIEAYFHIDELFELLWKYSD